MSFPTGVLEQMRIETDDSRGLVGLVKDNWGNMEELNDIPSGSVISARWVGDKVEVLLGPLDAFGKAERRIYYSLDQYTPAGFVRP